ncbi:MICOS complex subunit Mic60-like [Adelges cooleyi]|uniref:MICOS complex subunit Mic60-like n=1 Tax=Adelges cooleyi TaxID=133065 RepID=UPI00217F9366|nr:MICOS complex subunit Mic60-like [Adelges cooleyi]
MLNLKQFAKVSPGAKFNLRQSSLTCNKSLGRRFIHENVAKQRKSNVGKYTIGSLLFGFSAVVVYAKYDNNFRQWLKNNVSGSDELLKLILFEEKSFGNYPNRLIDNVKKMFIKPEKSSNEIVEKLNAAPLQNDTPKPQEKNEKPSIKQQKTEKKVLSSTNRKPPSDAKAIEDEAIFLLNEVSESYSDALNALKEYYELANNVINKSVNQSNVRAWETLKEVSTEKDKLYRVAKDNSREANKHLDKLQILLNDSENMKISKDVKERLYKLIVQQKVGIKQLAKDFETERDSLMLFRRYRDQIINIRRHFADELEAMFPHMRLSDKDMKLSNTEYEIFIKYITEKLLFYQRELFKEETVIDDKVKNAVDGLMKEEAEAINDIVDVKVQKNRRKLLENYIKDSFELTAEIESKLKQQLKLQSEVHMDHLAEAANLAAREVDRRVRLEYSEKAEAERLNYQQQVVVMTTVMQAIDDALKDHSKKEEKLNESVSLWTACKSLFTALTAEENVPKNQLKPLLQHVNDIKAAGQNHKVINELLQTIPEKVLTRGVYTEETLKDRFFNLEDKAFHMALVPDKDVKLLDLLTSFVFSLFIIRTPVPIPDDELANSPIDVNKLNNTDVLQRARYWVERDDFHQALRYMNLLKGGPKAIADDWMMETREYLETQQVAHTLLAYASAKLHSHVVVKDPK